VSLRIRQKIQSLSWKPCLSRIQVAVAVVIDELRRVLITRRSLQNTHGGFWEFPGGKLHEGEAGWDALVRELKEEVNIDVSGANYLGEIQHTYDDRDISLLVYHVYQYEGEAICCEDQMGLQWAEIDRLHEFQFPAANSHIIQLILNFK
jgi:8-oxo-dGTP diphosphatase